MADQGSFDEPSLTSSHATQVWETVRANIRAALALTPGSRAAPGVGALRRSSPAPGQLLLEAATDAAGTAWATVYDSRTKLDVTARMQPPALWVANGRIGLSTSANALTVSLLTHAGATPSAADTVDLVFPGATGESLRRRVTSAIGLTVPAGATLAHVSGVTCPVYVYLLDVAGTVELAVSHAFLGAYGVVSTTAISAASTDASTVYSAAARTSVPHVCLGRWGSTQTTAGTWASITGPQHLWPWPGRAPVLSSVSAIGATNWVRQWDTLSVHVLLQAGGGGGGGTFAVGPSQAAVGLGGGGGGAGQILRAAHLIPALVTVTVGHGGAGGGHGGNGAPGGATSFGTLATVHGGAGGWHGPVADAVSSIHHPSVLGGSGSGVDVLWVGRTGQHGEIHNATTLHGARGGDGGDSHMGAGGRSLRANANGEPGSHFGGGGSGGVMVQGSAVLGGAGIQGVVYIKEYF